MDACFLLIGLVGVGRDFKGDASVLEVNEKTLKKWKNDLGTDAPTFFMRTLHCSEQESHDKEPA